MLEGLKTAVKIPGGVVESDPAEPDRRLELSAWFRDDDDRLVAVEQRPCPRRVLPGEADVDAPSQVAMRELRRIADVEQSGACLCQFHHPIDRQWRDLALQRCLQRRPFPRVEDRVIGEVRGRLGLIGGHEGQECLWRHRLQRVVGMSLRHRSSKPFRS